MEKLWTESVKPVVESVDLLLMGDFEKSLERHRRRGLPPAFTISGLVRAGEVIATVEVNNQFSNFPSQIISDWYPKDATFIMMALISEADGIDYTKYYLNLEEAAKELKNDPSGLIIIDGRLEPIPNPDSPIEFKPYPSICQELRDLGRNKYRKYLEAISPK